jgi:hypothetical protein
MDFSIAELFVILSLNPDKGRVSLDSIHFRYTLTGALLMDYFEREEFKIENKRVIPSFRPDGDPVHDLFADKFSRSSKNRKISYWIGRLTQKSRFVFNELINTMEKKRTIRIEHKKFLNLFPYRRYWFNETGVRQNLIELLRGILLYGKQPSRKEIMLLGLVEASKAYKILSRQRGEARLLRSKNTELLKGDIMSSEINQAIREVQAAIVMSVTTATMAAHGSH